MKFKLAIFILKAFFYIAFPIASVIVGSLAIMKLNPITIMIGVFFIVFGCLEPFLAHDMFFKYTDQVLHERRKR